MTEAIIVKMIENSGAIAITLLLLFPMINSILKNQNNMNNKMIDRIDRLIASNLEGNSHLEGFINNQFADSERRICCKIDEAGNNINALTKQCALSQASMNAQEAVKHTDARTRHDDDVKSHGDAVTKNANTKPLGGTS